MGEPLADARLKWEYQWEEVPQTMWVKALENRGNDGWEAWHQYQAPGHGNWLILFKRPLLQATNGSGS